MVVRAIETDDAIIPCVRNKSMINPTKPTLNGDNVGGYFIYKSIINFQGWPSGGRPTKTGVTYNNNELQYETTFVRI